MAVTANFNFDLIEFDKTPWHEIHHNFQRSVDALLNKYISVTNFKGVWDNSLSISKDDIYVDPDLGSLWKSLVAHTSSTSGTFAADRATNAGRWEGFTVNIQNGGAWAASTAYAVNTFLTDSGRFGVTINTYTSDPTSYDNDVTNGNIITLIDSTARKDEDFFIVDSADVTKRWNFEVSNIPTGTTNVWTVPYDASVTTDIFVGRDTPQTLSNKVLNAPQINDTSQDHQYVFAVNELADDRTVTLPLLTGNDTFVFESHAQTLTNKTLAGLTLSDDLQFSNANPNIIGADTDGALSITADTATNQGGNIVLYGNTHGTKAQDIEFRADATIVMNWDESGSKWAITGGLDVSTDLDVDGTANLDAVDIDGNVQLDGTLTVGVDGTGKDVKFFGDTSSAFILWDESADKLLTAGGAVIDIVKDKLLIGSTAVTTTAAQLNILDGATVTTAELNLIDGGTARGTTSVASGDGILINDAGTMRMTNVDTVSTYFASHSVGGGNIVTTGALDAGSITSGFGSIDNGSSTITTTGAVGTGALTVGSGVVTIPSGAYDAPSLTFSGDTDLGLYAAAANTLGIWASAGIGIGTNNPDGDGIHYQSAGTAGTVTAHTDADELVIESNASAGISILTPNDDLGSLYFGDPDDNDVMSVRGDHANNRLAFYANGGNPSWYINNGHNFFPHVTESYLIGNSSYEVGTIYVQNSIVVSDKRRKTDHGALDEAAAIIGALDPRWFTFKDTVVDDITTTVKRPKMKTKRTTSTEIVEVDGKLVQKKVTKNVKKPVYESKDVHDEDGNVIGTKDEPVFESVEEVEKGRTITHSERRAGLMAQDVKSAMDGLGINDSWTLYRYDEESDTHSLQYQELIAVLVGAVKSLQSRVDALEG